MKRILWKNEEFTLGSLFARGFGFALCVFSLLLFAFAVFKYAVQKPASPFASMVPSSWYYSSEESGRGETLLCLTESLFPSSVRSVVLSDQRASPRRSLVIVPGATENSAPIQMEPALPLSETGASLMEDVIPFESVDESPPAGRFIRASLATD